MMIARVVALGILALTGCASARQTPTLYERLGGARAIYAVVDDFVGRVTTDPRVKRYFEGSNLQLVRQQLTQFVCQAAGGPCTYLGADMKTAHVGLGISDADFDAVAEDLVASLDKFKVVPRDKEELLAMLGRMRGDIVEKKP
jgi:hemoglobin